MKKILQLLFFITILLLSSGITSRLLSQDKVIIKIFHAGSLSLIFDEIEKNYEKEYPDVDIVREPSGSMLAVRKVTDLHKKADIIATADYSLISSFMIPEYVDLVKLFAKNEMVLTYTGKSKYADKITNKNWLKILEKNDIKWGFSDPSLDPCGFRTLFSILLASFYNKNNVFNLLISNNTNIKVVKKNDNSLIILPKDIKVISRNPVIRRKSVELIGLLESGYLDYAFEYKSIALQHNLKYISFPDNINLSNASLKDEYKRVKLRFPEGKEVVAKSITYGISLIKTSNNKKITQSVMDYILGEKGRKIFNKYHQQPIYPAVIVK